MLPGFKLVELWKFLQQFYMMDFLCDICGVSKLTEFEIKDHKRKAHDNLNQFVATWEIMKYKFGLSESLKIHIIKDHLF